VCAGNPRIHGEGLDTMATLRRSASVALPGPTPRIARVGPLERRERKLFLAFLTPGLVLSVGAIFLPVLYAIQLSFYHAETFIATPRFVGLANYVQMFADPRYW
jgi:multiple sugar transport system permease protein